MSGLTLTLQNCVVSKPIHIYRFITELLYLVVKLALCCHVLMLLGIIANNFFLVKR